MPPLAELANRIEARKDELSAASVATACTGSFWEERFGERGRRHIEADGHHHVGHLVSALHLGSPGILEHYARWLQSVLTVRGMCSRHIEEHFEALRLTIEESIEDATPALDYLDAAVGALHYERGPARVIAAAEGEMLSQIMEGLHAHWEGWFRGKSAISHQRVERDAAYLLSYLCDAVARERIDLFCQYTAWIEGYFHRRKRPAHYLPALLAAVILATSALPADVAARVREVVQAASSGLRQGDL